MGLSNYLSQIIKKNNNTNAKRVLVVMPFISADNTAAAASASALTVQWLAKLFNIVQLAEILSHTSTQIYAKLI